MAEIAQDPKLKLAYKLHLEETKIHKERIDKNCMMMGICPNVSSNYKAIKGLIEQCLNKKDLKA